MRENACERRVGRLLEIRVVKGYETADDVDQMIRMIGACVTALPADVRHVTVADWRLCKVLANDAADRAVEMMRGTNPRTERSAVLHSTDSPTAVMQFLRLVRESEHPRRRLFSDKAALLDWIGEVATPEELRRAQEFLGQGVPRMAAG
jgi:hypothetical protein